MKMIIFFGIALVVLLTACGRGEPSVYVPIAQDVEPIANELAIDSPPIMQIPQPPITQTEFYVYVPQAQFSPFVEYWLGQLTLEEKIGQLIMPRLPWQTTSVGQVEAWLEAVPFGGFILFSDNVQSIEQVQQLTTGLQAQARLPLLISTDEEGGRVSRVGRLFGGATPAAFDIGANAYDYGRENARRLLELGINMNLAPVADVWSNPANAVIGNRAFGHEAEAASLNVVATVEGLQSGGVIATLKHFPGHGDTYEDSHYQLAFHNHGVARFWEVESIPFTRGLWAGAKAVMTGHISTPYVSGHTALLPWMEPWIESGNLPATFSDFWLQDVLRGIMGFNGVIITDGLEMRALTDHFTCGQIALGAFLAGADILLIPANPVEAFDALLAGYHAGYFDMERLDESVARILELKEPFQ